MLLSAEHERELFLHDRVFTVHENVLNQLGVVKLKGQPKGLRVSIELSEDFKGRCQQSRVLWLGHVRHAARQVQADSVEGSL